MDIEDFISVPSLAFMTWRGQILVLYRLAEKLEDLVTAAHCP